MICAVKVQLASEYEVAAASFSTAVPDLRRNIGTSTKDRYDQLGKIANDARLKSEHARLTLEKHVGELRC